MQWNSKEDLRERGIKPRSLSKLYFGGKASVAPIVWQALGQPKHYIEPFFGSGAVLLARPGYNPARHIETICDANGFIANVWRAMQNNPDAVAKFCDHPVNHADLSARKKVLLQGRDGLLQHLINDETYYDAKLAGYWIWGTCCWIGAGMDSIGAIPNIGNPGRGVHAIGKRPHLANPGRGVHAIGKRPHLGDAGVGVHAIGQRPHLGDPMRNVQDPFNDNIYRWFRQLSERLRYVRVVCGDWSRVCNGHWQDGMGDVGFFFDPPYGVADRDNVYGDYDDTDVAHKVRQWCIERGRIPTYRIVLTGYDEHTELLDAGWRIHRWRTGGGYGNSGNKSARSKKNRYRECIYISPHCVNAGLFNF